MIFTPIDIDTYTRRDTYNRYLKMQCTYSLTVQIEITQLCAWLKIHGLKVYPAQIWLLLKAVNSFREFRMCLNKDNILGFWDKVSPLYTSSKQGSDVFSSIYTEYNYNFEKFYSDCIKDMMEFTNGKDLPQTDYPQNICYVSSLPWLDFTGFNINVPDKMFTPIFTIGKHIEQDGKTLMPLAIQVHHAVCDGYHVGLFVEEVKHLAKFWVM